MGKDDGALALALQRGKQVQQESIVAILGRRYTVFESAELIVSGSSPLVHALAENGGLATAKSNVWSPPSFF